MRRPRRARRCGPWPVSRSAARSAPLPPVCMRESTTIIAALIVAPSRPTPRVHHNLFCGRGLALSCWQRKSQDAPRLLPLSHTSTMSATPCNRNHLDALRCSHSLIIASPRHPLLVTSTAGRGCAAGARGPPTPAWPHTPQDHLREHPTLPPPTNPLRQRLLPKAAPTSTPDQGPVG